jgi:hypothetical protein
MPVVKRKEQSLALHTGPPGRVTRTDIGIGIFPDPIAQMHPVSSAGADSFKLVKICMWPRHVAVGLIRTRVWDNPSHVEYRSFIVKEVEHASGRPGGDGAAATLRAEHIGTKGLYVFLR